jgi:SAM-dependent methyltransferase
VSSESRANAQGSLNPEFDRYAAEYDEELERGLSVSGEGKNYFARGRLIHLARCLAQRGFAPGAVMDFGCGIGSATPFVFEAFPGVRRLIGTDVSEQSLAYARRSFASDRAEFRLMSDYAPRGELDLVFCNGVFHHIPPKDRAALVHYIRDCLRPGGLFALFENNPWNPGTRYIMSRVSFDRDAIPLSPPEGRRVTTAGSFEAALTDFLFVFPRALRWLRPIEWALRKLPLGGQYLVLGVKTAG